MASFASDSLILVTGANGHVAQHVVDQALHHPARPRVRATVRSAASVDALKSYWAEYVDEGRLEVVRVPDITANGAFDDAVKGVTHIAHIASPIIVNPKDVENDLLKPAIRGTTGILRSAKASGTVKAVVITSSFGSAADISKGLRPGYIYTADDWNPLTYEQPADPNLDYSAFPEIYRPYVTYTASKVAAERAAWAYHKSEGEPFRLSVMLPVYVSGLHVLPLTKGAESLSFSNLLIWRCATDAELVPFDFPGWVDVRDVAKAHLAALERPETSGKRYLLVAASTNYAQIADIIRAAFPQLNPPKRKQDFDVYGYDGSPALLELGLGKYIGLEKMVTDVVAQTLEAQESKKTSV
ncbi:aldehyde reductase II [Punctularia strigosozonata HHB-11173 SS5]|uniref:Aldehyde reductase II n=1 Tax=Punctularia strigosozonata (strain HHB-11173) TaxID=741275 RepID=R7S5H4_PUNST|nr:aldehyde reductase II [Punctularia strigosozonata HHB-11173 SS5]EIN04661.1 aldehyde reductase II [Punctularia strigosozonata HHB-11173 SS5]